MPPRRRLLQPPGGIIALVTDLDERFMAAALECAELGRGAVEPNPMVGAVLVRDGRELARGWHRRFGGPHAEVECLAAARAAGVEPRGATMYATLEPCCHYGKTPPCTDALMAAGVAQVVACMKDPDPRVAGKGLEILRRAGVAVRVGVLERRGRELLAPYIKLRTAGRPWVICKWAQTADGYLSLPVGRGRWISCEQSRAAVHRLRGLCDGVLVGVGTVLADDPLLTNRSGAGRQPARVVLDAGLRMPLDCRLVATARQHPLLIAATATAIGQRADAAASLAAAGAEVLALPAAASGGAHAGEPACREQCVSLPALLNELGRRQWTNLLVEGGKLVLESFIGQRLADELHVYRSPVSLGPAGGEPADGSLAGLPRVDVQALVAGYALREETCIGSDRFARYGLGELSNGGMQ
jgi:diaminohydroxyphosphoribosylaminopyrimidine deaminase/5-amino-6-(5-phosphoribosylamino)uracil reductase